ncbi:transposase [Pseudofrankia sp. DC12]|uniref:IS701 family transposase n=1 Tax=Pseudofrankia sp. DC12 TaxID=683315 RepID=UPI0005F82FCD|nr:transposase [Pseudofrankia sp. DC12]
MLPHVTIPPSFAVLLEYFRPCFTAPSFAAFRMLATGLVAAPGRRTVVGMLVGAGRHRDTPHHRAHYFFAKAAWTLDEVGDTLARLVVGLLTGPGPITVVVDDTLFHRAGRKVFAAGWFHDGAAKGETPVGFGNNWVIVGVVLRGTVFARPICLPVYACLVVKGTMSGSRLWLAARAAARLARLFPDRQVHVVADSAYAGGELKSLPRNVTWTTRPRADAALFAPAPPRTGRRGRPRVKGDRLATITQLAATADFRPTTVTRYGRVHTVDVAVTVCLWYSVFGPRLVQLVLVREPGRPLLALISTDLFSRPATIAERYAARWAVEVAIADAKQLFGVGQTHTRTAQAVRHAVPFALLAQTLTLTWYLTAGHHDSDVADATARAPWYTTKTTVSTADALGKLRRVLITARFRPADPVTPTAAEIHTLHLAWDTTEHGLAA